MASEMNTSHACPGCGVKRDHIPRYPWNFCGECCAEAVDVEGCQLIFANVSFSGGFQWRYRDETNKDYRQVLGLYCFISGRPVMVTEARFGGIVAQPILTTTVGTREGRADLTKRK